MTNWNERLGITEDQFEVSGPSNPMGIQIKYTCEQFAEIRNLYDAGDTPFDCQAKPNNPYRDRIDELLPRAVQIQQRRKLVDQNIEPEYSLSENASAEQVRLANGKNFTIVRRGTALMSVDPDDTDLKPAKSFQLKVLL